MNGLPGVPSLSAGGEEAAEATTCVDLSPANLGILEPWLPQPWLGNFTLNILQPSLSPLIRMKDNTLSIILESLPSKT